MSVPASFFGRRPRHSFGAPCLLVCLLAAAGASAQSALPPHIGVQVTAAIAGDPGRVESVISAAISAAPEHRVAIAKLAARNFPGFSQRIAAAADLPVGSIGGYGVIVPSANAKPWPVYQPPLTNYSSKPYVAAASPPLVLTPPKAPPLEPPQAPPAPRETVEETTGPEEINDPAESFNRVIFTINDGIDSTIFRPLAKAYGYVMPDAAKPAAQRFFRNLNEPIIAINDLVQLEPIDSASAVGRFAVNSTAGVLGLFEMAEPMGLKRHTADFGQTLHSYGAGSGAYVVLPILGPSTLRDGTGIIVDTVADPFGYVLSTNWRIARTAGQGLVKRETLLKPLDNLKKGSMDYYAALRSAYYQDRVKGLRKGRGGDSEATEEAADDLFDEAE